MKKALGMFLAVCMMMSVICSFNITASAMATIPTPTITVSNNAKAISVSWKKVSGAKTYKVYKKVAGAKKYSVVKTTNNKTTKFVDKKVTVGKTYYYKVSAISNAGDVKTSKTKSIVRLLAPINVKVKLHSSGDDYGSYDSGVKLTWTKSKGANEYTIYKKVNNGKYKYLVTLSSTNSYFDTSVTTKGVANCYYKIVAAKNNSTSVASSVKKIVYVEEPVIVPSVTASGVLLDWNRIKKCDGYKLYRSTSGKNGTYSLIAKLDNDICSYIDNKVEVNKKYYYKLVAYKGSVKSNANKTDLKYEPLLTVNVKAGETSDALQKYIKSQISNLQGIILFKEYMKKIAVFPLDTNISTVTDDGIVVGVSKGTTKADYVYKYTSNGDKISIKVGFVLINVE